MGIRHRLGRRDSSGSLRCKINDISLTYRPLYGLLPKRVPRSAAFRQQVCPETAGGRGRKAQPLATFAAGGDGVHQFMTKWNPFWRNNDHPNRCTHCRTGTLLPFWTVSGVRPVSCDAETSTITNRQDLTPPQHAPGVYPHWLAEQGVTVVIAGGMGGTARDLFAAADIQVVLGAQPGDPEEIVRAYLAGRLEAGGERLRPTGTVAQLRPLIELRLVRGRARAYALFVAVTFRAAWPAPRENSH